MKYNFLNKKLMVAATFIVSTGCVVFFQNCSAPKKFTVDSSYNNTVCDSSGNCINSAAIVPVPTNQRAADQQAADQRAADQQAADQRAADQQAADQRAADQRAADQRAADQRAADQRAADQRAADQRAADQRAADQQAAALASMVNVVAGDEKTCNNAVADFIRTKLSASALVVYAQRCQIGAGCGISCGKPNGTTCLSANPNSYGVCLSSSDIQSAQSINTEVYNARTGFNFVAGDSTSCNNSIAERFRVATGRSLASVNLCGLGKGCGISCGSPNGSSCISANPSAHGACIGYDELKNLN